MIPEYPKFKPLGLEDKPILAKHLRLTSRNVCELSLGNIFIWKTFDNTQLTCINHNVCMLLSQANEPPYFLEPLGHHRLNETVEIMLKHIGRIARVSAHFISRLTEGKYKLSPQRNQFDYVYLTTELAELKGRKFDGKRNHIKKFRAKFPAYEFAALTPDLKREALSLFDRWFKIREASRYFPKLAYARQKAAITEAFSNFEELKIIGGALLFEKSLKGFALGSPLNPETVSVHFLYSDPDLPGIFQTILWEAANKTFSSYKYMNLEQDLGIPGLRTAKLSYHPLKLEEKFEITPL